MATCREAIERYLAAYNSFDVERMLAELHPDMEFTNRSNGKVTAHVRGREEFRQLAERAAAIFASRRQTVREFRSEGVEARITVDYEGVLAEDLSPELPAGHKLELTGGSTFRFQDDLIISIVDES